MIARSLGPRRQAGPELRSGQRPGVQAGGRDLARRRRRFPGAGRLARRAGDRLLAPGPLGLAATLVRRETRWYGLLVLIPSLFFFLAAITVAAYHAQARHLNALYPLLATLAWPGALAVTGSSSCRRAGARAAALLLVAAAAAPTLIATIQKNLRINRPDSRLAAYRWLRANLPRDERILLDDYGPPLNESRPAADRLAAALRAMPPGPFTQHQELRIDLLRRYPPPDGFNLDPLGHQWWLPREKSDAELRGNAADLDMGNPLVSRQPRPLAEYRREGVRYVVTNSLARNQYFTPAAAARASPRSSASTGSSTARCESEPSIPRVGGARGRWSGSTTSPSRRRRGSGPCRKGGAGGAR